MLWQWNGVVHAVDEVLIKVLSREKTFVSLKRTSCMNEDYLCTVFSFLNSKLNIQQKHHCMHWHDLSQNNGKEAWENCSNLAH